MATIYISKIKVRRGTDAQRKTVRFDQGELISTIDTRRLYVGNGVLSGGEPISTKIHPPLTKYSSLSDTMAEVGDLVSVNSIWYQLTATPYNTITNWGDMRSNVSQEFEYGVNSTLTIKLSGLSASKINPNTVNNGLIIKNNTLQVDYNTSFFEISSNQVSLKRGGVTQREILSSSYNTNFFEISSNQLSLKRGGITQREILSSSFGNGISGGNNQTIQLKANPADFYFDGGFLKSKISIYSALTGNSTKNSNNSLSAIFNGSITNNIPGLNITQFDVISSNGVSSQNLTLSSAGFLTFEENITTKSGTTLGRFAIPIFKY